MGEGERRRYEDVLQRNADELLAAVRPGDVVLHCETSQRSSTRGATRAIAPSGISSETAT